MNFLKAFPKDKNGKYFTKKILQDFNNGELVQIFKVKTACEEKIFDDNYPANSQKINFSVATVDFSNFIQQNSFDAAQAIKNFFDSTERGVDRRCTRCHGATCSKSHTLPTASKFIVVQLKRFMVRQLQYGATTHKINTEAKPFSSVEIQTDSQGFCTYNVIATVQHLGTQLVQGHYIAYVKQNGNWLQCNDDRITPLGPNTSDPTRNAYLLILKHADD